MFISHPLWELLKESGHGRIYSSLCFNAPFYQTQISHHFSLFPPPCSPTWLVVCLSHQVLQFHFDISSHCLHISRPPWPWNGNPECKPHDNNVLRKIFYRCSYFRVMQYNSHHAFKLGTIQYSMYSTVFYLNVVGEYKILSVVRNTAYHHTPEVYKN